MNSASKSIESSIRKRDRSVYVVAALMIIFGIAEVVTGFRRNFFGIHTSDVATATYLGAAIGFLYSVAGILILTMKRPAVALALVLLIMVIIGRIVLVVTGLYPIDSRPQMVAIALGTATAAAFAIFIRLKWKVFA